jgi:hypothetical protein
MDRELTIRIPAGRSRIDTAAMEMGYVTVAERAPDPTDHPVQASRWA